MSFVDPTAVITQLKAQIGASAAWVAAGGVDGNIHYPNGDGTDTGFPAVILSEENSTRERNFYGGRTTPGSDLQILLYDKTSTGKLEKLARDMSDEICVDLGLANLSVVGITPADDYTDAEEAEGTALIYALQISLTFGLTV